MNRSLILLNEMGDVEIVWDSDQDDTMREIIQKKMDEGVKFFIMKPFLGMFERKAKLNDLADLDRNRVKIKDEDIENLFCEGKVAFHRRNQGEIEISHRATSAQEAASGQSIGVRQLVGG